MTGTPRLGGVVVVGWNASASTRPMRICWIAPRRCCAPKAAGCWTRRAGWNGFRATPRPTRSRGWPTAGRLRRLMDDLAPGGALAVIDLDQFKVVNDRFGHSAGDQVLRDFAACLRRICGLGETAARLGGEEFVVVCPSGGVAAGSLAMRNACATR